MAIIEIPSICPGVESSLQIVLTKNTNKSFTAILKGGTGVPLDLTAATITLTVKRSATSSDTILTKAGSIVLPAVNGKVQFDFVPADTSSVSAGIYYFTITATSGTLGTQTPVAGEFRLEPYDQAFIGKLEPLLSLSITNATERISLETRDVNNVLANPADLLFQLLDDGDRIIVEATYPNAIILNPQGGIFTTDFISNRVGDYLAIWTYRFMDQEPEKVIKNIRFVSPAMFRMIPEVRMYIDKSRKASNTTIAFTPADVAVYIENSLRDFNAQPPSTALQLENIDNTYKEILVLGAIIQSLVAQGLLAVDQDFMYNDNGISLTIDHSTKILSWYSALLQQYITKKKLLKPNFFSGTVLARTIVGQAWSLGLAKLPASTASRFRGWI